MVLPSTPYDAKGLLKSAIRDDNPVVFFEDKMMYKLKGPGAGGGIHHPAGRGRCEARRAATSPSWPPAAWCRWRWERRRCSSAKGISAEVIDPRTTWPLDEKTLIESAKKTSRAIVVDEGYERYGVTAEIAAVIAQGAFYNLDAPVKRIGAMHVPIPFSPPLEDATVPSERAVFQAALVLCGKKG